MTKEDIFNRLWENYTSQNPDAKRVYDLFVAEGEKVENDHIAFRTFDDSRINIDVLAKVFLENGYVYKQDYHFETKKLYAKHFEYKSDSKAPRVFISQLKTKEFSDFLQRAVKETIDKLSGDLLDSSELIYSGNQWGKPSYKVYEKLRDESEYAAWLYVNGFTANHFTVSVNSLKKYDTIQKVNDFLKQNGFLMNNPKNEIQGTPEELLEQSSVKAGLQKVSFIEGEYEVPACYYEFAKRYNDETGKLYSGFIAKSADKIFESTDFYKKN
jgi:hypothetical protein